MPLIYNGQEIQYKSGGRVSLAEKTPIDWTTQPDTAMTSLITTLAHLKHTQSALRTGVQNGKLTNLVTTADDCVYAYKRTLGDDNVVVMLNFSDDESRFTIPAGLPEGRFRDALTGERVDLSPSAEFVLASLDAVVLVKE